MQLYIHDEQSSLPRPYKELKGFQKVFLKAGEAKTITFHISKNDLSFFQPEQHAWVAEKGVFKALVGASSADIKSEVSFELE